VDGVSKTIPFHGRIEPGPKNEKSSGEGVRSTPAGGENMSGWGRVDLKAHAWGGAEDGESKKGKTLAGPGWGEPCRAS